MAYPDKLACPLCAYQVKWVNSISIHLWEAHKANPLNKDELLALVDAAATGKDAFRDKLCEVLTNRALLGGEQK